MPFFSRLEWLLALRYLRARRQEGFISVIAVFSFLGIMLGVATLIIVMSVMNGFRAELMGRILGLNGHLTIQAEAGTSLKDFEFVTEAVAGLPGVVSSADCRNFRSRAVCGEALAASICSQDASRSQCAPMRLEAKRLKNRSNGVAAFST